MTDFDELDPGAPPEWNADFRAAEDLALEASLAATPSQRLAWLEKALAFALKVGALQRPDEEICQMNRGLDPGNGTAVNGG